MPDLFYDIVISGSIGPEPFLDGFSGILWSFRIRLQSIEAGFHARLEHDGFHWFQLIGPPSTVIRIRTGDDKPCLAIDLGRQLDELLVTTGDTIA